MNVQPSSLVFVAILAMWAVYLVPQWLRRRETLAQSRSGDRNSEGLRVLERRDRSGTGPSTAGLLGPRDSRRVERCDSPEIATGVGRTVSTGEVTSGGAAFSDGSLPERSGPRSVLPEDRTPPSEDRRDPQRTSPPAQSPPDDRASTRYAPADDVEGSPPDQVGNGAPHPRSRQARDAARRRARVLLALLVFVTISWGATLAPVFPWWAALPATGLLLADLVALRLTALSRAPTGSGAIGSGAQREHPAQGLPPSCADSNSAGTGQRQGQRRSSAPAGCRPGHPSQAGPGAPADRGTAGTGSGRLSGTRRLGVPRVPRMPISTPEGVLSGRESLADPVTWDPVPVPPPTYTLKPKAPDPCPGTPDGPTDPGGQTTAVPGPGESRPPADTPGPSTPTTAQPPHDHPQSPAARSGGPARSAADRTGTYLEQAEDDAVDLDEVLARRRAVNG
jgi:hypothetical protein